MLDFFVTLIIGFVTLSLFISFLYGMIWLFIRQPEEEVRLEKLDPPSPTRSGKEETE